MFQLTFLVLPYLLFCKLSNLGDFLRFGFNEELYGVKKRTFWVEAFFEENFYVKVPSAFESD